MEYNYVTCLSDGTILLTNCYVRQLSFSVTTPWLQRDQTLAVSVKGVACETI